MIRLTGQKVFSMEFIVTMDNLDIYKLAKEYVLQTKAKNIDPDLILRICAWLRTKTLHLVPYKRRINEPPVFRIKEYPASYVFNVYWPLTSSTTDYIT